jgi:hypothetical protein
VDVAPTAAHPVRLVKSLGRDFRHLVHLFSGASRGPGKDKGDQMKTAALATCLTVALLAAAACDRDVQTGRNGAQVPSSQQGVAAQTSFTLADKNGDGSVSRDEASTIPNLDFSASDADRNAQLSPEEYRIAMEKARPRG